MLDAVLQQIGSQHLASLWTFYRSYFSDDTACLQFIYEAICHEPIFTGRTFRETAEPGVYRADDGTEFHENVLFPRRMLNSVQRLVSTAHDMEQVRKGKDVFKLVFLITCAETLQTLAGKEGTKTQLIFSFFEEHTPSSDRAFIASHFFHDDDDSPNDGTEDNFKLFIAVLNEFRNCATHEGEYWDFCFNNNGDNCPIIMWVKINLVRYSRKGKRDHCFRTEISYQKFEEIFVRTCIAFIQDYVKRTFPTPETQA